MPFRLKIGLTFLLITLALAGCMSFAEDITPPPGYQPPPTQPPTTPTAAVPVFPVLPPDPVRGAALYAENCAPCHGKTGLGDGPDAAKLPNPVSAIGSVELARQSTPADWYLMVANGNLDRYMPPFSSLSVPQRWDVIAYVYSLSAPDEQLAQGALLFAENCATCHGESGLGDGPKSGELSTSPLDFTEQAFMGERSAHDFYTQITAGTGEMPAYGDELSENERWALADYLRFLTFMRPEGSAPLGGEATPVQDEPTAAPASDSTPGAESASTVESIENASEGTGFVQVLVAHGADGEIPAGAEVLLYGYENMQEAYNQRAELTEDGFVFFEDVPMNDGWVYLATVEYDGVVYGSNLAQVTADSTETVLDITVYDVSNDSSLLTIDRMHIFFEFIAEDTIQVIQLLLLSNPSGQTISAADPEQPLLVFELPEGATNLNVQESMRLRYSAVEGGLGIGTVRPSAEPYEITFAFDLPYEKAKLDLTLPIPLDTGAALVIAPQDGVKVRGDQLTDTGARDLQGVAYTTYTAENLNAGETLSMTVSGLPDASTEWLTTSGAGSNMNLVIGLSAFGLTFVLVGLYLWQRNRNAADDDGYDEDAELSEGTAVESADELIDSIIALDDLYKSGELGEDAYRRRRAELKERLKEIVE